MKTINFAGTIYKCKDIHILNIDAYMLFIHDENIKNISTDNDQK
jgi:hypothetical protein